jgi:Asp-tRNA(Asn)/Glu-tRNA(Gln) amidotransferase A subunit family amidase
VVLTPSAPGEAPRGLAATGAPTFNRIWSLLGGPCLSLPCGWGQEGMPLGAQLAALPGQDAFLLGTALRVERVMAAALGASDLR